MFGIANNSEFLAAIGIANASEDIKAKVIAGLEDLAQKRLIVKLADKITDDQAEEFGKIEDQKKAYEWLITNVPDLSLIMTDVLEEMKNEILANKAKVVGA